MAFLPFEKKTTDAQRPLSVSELSLAVKAVLADHLPGKIRVTGEISNLSDRSHLFFSLKDESAAIRCVCFASNARRLGFSVRDGMQVIATGRLDYYEAQGNLQFYVEKLEPVGEGSLEQRLKAMIEELRGLGYFDPERKRPIPAMAQRIAVVTSKTGAALQDVINTASRRWLGCQLLLYDVLVQGDRAAPRIADAINNLSHSGRELGIDAILLTRGGGSIEDLWAFNERIVADAIHHCTLPIVAAIGHETDTTVAELVADLRCATPTQAAMTLVPDRDALAMQVDQLAHRMSLLLGRRLQHDRQRLEAVAKHSLFRRPQRIVEQAGEEVAFLRSRLGQILPGRLRGERQRLDAISRHPVLRRPDRIVQAAERKLANLQSRLESIGPMNVLKRGYSYTLNAAGEVLRSADRAKPGEHITTVLAEGKLRSTVDGGDRTGGPGSGTTRLAGGRRRKDATSPGLFDA